MSSFHFSFLFIIFMFGCERKAEERTSLQDIETSAQSVSILPGVFKCSPEIVGSADYIMLIKTSAKLKELAVRRPGNETSHFLVVGSPPEEMLPLMTPMELSSLGEVRISVSGVVGLEWRNGAKSEKVFTVPGVYEFSISSNFESEEDVYICRVTFNGNI